MKIRTDNRPSDYEYAVLSHDVYSPKKLKDNVLMTDVPGRPPQKWQVVSIKTGSRDYFGVIYKNSQTQHLIVAHRGSTGAGSFLEDIQGVFLNADSPQKKDAYALTQEAMQMAQENDYTLSFTGHSLGAYLSELSLYFLLSTVNPQDNLESDVREGAHAVTFESPGSSNTLSGGLLKTHIDSTGIKESTLDITTYLSYPNLINTCNQHVGTVYTLMPDVGGWAQLPGFHLAQVHSMTNILTLFKDHAEKRPELVEVKERVELDVPAAVELPVQVEEPVIV